MLSSVGAAGTLNDYEKEFVANMNHLKNAGFDFELGSRAALEGKFGGAAEALLRDLPDVTRTDPNLFVKELSRVFGKGSAGFLEPIAKYAKAGLFPPIKHGNTSVESLINLLGPPTGNRGQDGLEPMHDFRVKDEEGNYTDDAG